MKRSRIFFAIFLLLWGLQGGKITTDAEPGWVTSVAGTYTGRVTGSDNYAPSVTIAKANPKVITVNTKDLRDNSTSPVTGIAMNDPGYRVLQSLRPL